METINERLEYISKNRVRLVATAPLKIVKELLNTISILKHDSIAGDNVIKRLTEEQRVSQDEISSLRRRLFASEERENSLQQVFEDRETYFYAKTIGYIANLSQTGMLTLTKVGKMWYATHVSPIQVCGRTNSVMLDALHDLHIDTLMD